jgi:hypothetical protein
MTPELTETLETFSQGQPAGQPKRLALAGGLGLKSSHLQGGAVEQDLL